jgi:F-type H+-transporting ATPase subunit delta
MHTDNHQSPLAVAYARALLELANESQKAPAIGEELRDVRQIVDSMPDLRQLLADPAISRGERGKLLSDAFAGQVSPLLMNFIHVLSDKGRLAELSAIAGAYDDLLDDLFGKVEVDVTVAQRLSDEQLEGVRQRVGAALKKDAVIHQYVDESIIGGIILRVQDQLIDGSVRTQLKQIKEKILSGRPR